MPEKRPKRPRDPAQLVALFAMYYNFFRIHKTLGDGHPGDWSMIRKSGGRFSEKIMRHQDARAQIDSICAIAL
jgi:hypothetical protein